ncbi:hypothetical protein GCM10023153_34110 [Ornithinibacter aureus]|uniref:Uncharacterized protein n=1 Tax=Ornithinibacter aureus TaxID=622664 RepID=A0ABP8KC84_9MICO
MRLGDIELSHRLSHRNEVKTTPERGARPGRVNAVDETQSFDCRRMGHDVEHATAPPQGCHPLVGARINQVSEMPTHL